MKPAKFLIAAFFTLFLIGFSTPAQSFSDQSSENPIYTRVPDSVMIVDIQLKSNVLTIKSITIKQGRYNERRQKAREIPPHEPPMRSQLFLLDSSQRILFETEFEFPKAITIPPAPPGTYDPYTPSVIPIEEPEVSIVIPHFREASFVEIHHPGTPPQETIKQIDQTEDRKDESFLAPVPAPAEEGKFHILVMASDYDSSNMSGFTTVANSIKNFILPKEPFLSYSPDTEIHIFSNTADLGCYGGCAGIDRLICCSSGLVVSAAASSGYLYDEIIVVHNTNVYGGGGYRESGTAYKTNSYSTFAVTYAGNSHKEVALHEFGHSFGNLCDEYSYGTEGYSYYDCVNCRPSCSDWSPILDGCQVGCDARSNYYRPDNSIMFALNYPDFNEVSIKATYFPDGLEERLQYFAGSQVPSGIVLQLPLNGAVFDSSDLITTHQPSFNWIESGTMTRCTLLFSTSNIDFSKPIARASVSGTNDSWTPSIFIWKKLMSASNNSGGIRDIYWKVIGTLPNRSPVGSEVWSFSIDPPQEVTNISPADGATLPSGDLPTFGWKTNGNVKFKLEISSLPDFGNSTKIKSLNYTIKDPNVETTLSKILPSFQWNAVKKMIGAGQGYFRIKAWDAINRGTVSGARSFMIQ
jgi:hypothetical protein